MSNEGSIAFVCPQRRPLYPNLDEGQQTAMVALGFVYILITTVGFLNLYKNLDKQPSPSWWNTFKQVWPLLGIFPFLISGIQFHFVDAPNFLCITPPNGTWGWWYLPISTEFQLESTGYVEVVGGLVLSICGMIFKNNTLAVQLRKHASFVLCFMTIGMTFANLYMLTHGVWAYELEDAFPLAFHVLRLTVQSAWLSALWYMATHESLIASSSREKRRD